MEERIKTNYDHPDAFDTELMIMHLKELMAGNEIEKPKYDFEKHTRGNSVLRVIPRDIIIVEGILVLQEEAIRNLLDIKIFVDTDADVRIIRRIVRDVEERGRSVQSVIDQYLNSVRPMHLQFTEPSKRYADLIIPEGGENKVAIDLLVAKINHYLNSEK